MRRQSKFQLWAGGAAVVGLMLLAGCWPFDDTNYRTTIVISTPQGLVTGSAVRRVSRRSALLDDHPHYWERGEAVAIDLPNGQTLFSLVGNPNEDWFLLKDEAVGWRIGGFRLWPGHPASPRWKTPYGLPLMVRFRDIRDPKSVEQVDPTNLSASFGPGYSLKSVTINTTFFPRTTGIEQRLGWLRHEGETLNPDGGPTTHPTFAQTVRQNAFSTEIKS